MSLPPLICFTSEDAAIEMVFAWWGVGAQLVDEGMRVLLVNADPTGTVERMFPEIEQVIRRTGGSGAMNLIHNVEARPELIDLRPIQSAFFGRAPEQGALVLLPAHRVHEAPDPRLAERAPDPAEAKAVARAIRGQLWANDRFDVVLALLPPGVTPLGTALLKGCADLAVQLRAAPLPEEEPLAPPSGPIRCLSVTLGNSYANRERLFFPPLPMVDGGPPRSYLQDGPLIRRCELLVERLRRELVAHPRLLRARFRACALQSDWPGIEETFGALWAASRDEALDLFQEEMLRGISVPHEIGASALRAVVNRPGLSFADQLYLASQTVQAFRWARPTRDAELAAEVLERLLAADRGGPHTGRLVVETADALCHLVLWRQASGASREQTWPTIVRIHELLGQRTRVALQLPDERRWARAAATFTRLTGDSACVNELRDCLDRIALHLPQSYLRTASLALLWCAIGLQRSELFEEVIGLCDQLIPESPVIGLYRRALAWVHTGFFGDAMLDLQELGRIDRDASLKALIDPDFRPLWSVAGDPNLKVPRPR